jgi:hypothetical protein
MSPFKGQGANQAIMDAVLLADCLEQAVRKEGPAAGMDSALPKYEREMLRRSASKVEASREAASILHSEAAQAVDASSQVAGSVITALQQKGIGAWTAVPGVDLNKEVASVLELAGAGANAVLSSGCPTSLHINKVHKSRMAGCETVLPSDLAWDEGSARLALVLMGVETV